MFGAVSRPAYQELMTSTMCMPVNDLIDKILCCSVSGNERLLWVMCLTREQFIVVGDMLSQVGDMESWVCFRARWELKGIGRGLWMCL